MSGDGSDELRIVSRWNGAVLKGVEIALFCGALRSDRKVWNALICAVMEVMSCE
jgi:hypothetical protein